MAVYHIGYKNNISLTGYKRNAQLRAFSCAPYLKLKTLHVQLTLKFITTYLLYSNNKSRFIHIFYTQNNQTRPNCNRFYPKTLNLHYLRKWHQRHSTGQQLKPLLQKTNQANDHKT